MNNFRILSILLPFVLVLFQVIINSDAEKAYTGYKVFSVKKASTKEQYEALLELQKQPKLDFWSDPSHMRTTDIMVAPQQAQFVEEYLNKHGLQYDVMIRDVQGMVENETTTQRENRQGGMNWKQYHRLEVIYAWLEAQAHQNPRVVQISNIGKSSEGRPIKMAKISTSTYQRTPAIVVDAGIHAREWIAPATATYIMKQLLSVPLEDRDLIDSVEWYFIPVLNPDGYEYTHTEDRLWRKTRSTVNGEDCIGVDANRNFDFHFGEAGTKDDPCANTYPGPFAFSEPEANASATFLWNNRGKVRAYLTLHSYSQLFLTPYGYTEDLPEDYDELHELGVKAAKALEEVHGTEYDVGAPSHILYANSGSSRDWAKGVAEIKYPFTMELRDKGDSGFLLPASEILPTAEETWEAVKVIARKVIKDSQTRQRPRRPNLYSGSSMDWAREYAKVKYAYTVELRDDGENKFFVPESEITATGEETWAAFKVIARQVIKDSLNKPAGGFKDIPNSSQNKKSTTELDNETEEIATEEEEDEEDEDDPSTK